jgi:YD repeat-containing protein
LRFFTTQQQRVKRIFNQLIWQKTPDAGESNFYYNEKGQLRLSQNAQQSKENNYSYTRYDEQGRIIEVGELNTALITCKLDTGLNICALRDSIQTLSFPSPAYASNHISDLTRTHYDFAKGDSIGSFKQSYLRSRVAWVEVIDKNATDTTATYYTYDVHGNVKALLQQIPGLGNKRTDYVYDLVSGKVNYVFYQYRKPDQFVHKYEYDADNRLTSVFTSTDRFIWNQEASYYYYKHGPLARVELGAYRSQGQDYYYTLQGWIKGVNQPYSTGNNDGNNVGKDVYAYALGYYENDYKPINASLTTTDRRDKLWTRLNETIKHKGLYNGNISWMVTDLAKVGEMKNDRSKGIQAMLYKYDQLHRITKSRSLTNYTQGTGFASRTTTLAPYDETYTYDANGNILTLNRMNGEGALMDDFNYKYYAASNKLRGVLPIVRDTLYKGTLNSNTKLYRDITIQGSNVTAGAGSSTTLKATENVYIKPTFGANEGADFAAYIPEEGPFVYDAIGNLTADQEEGVKISWTPYGKIREVKTHNDSVVVKFRYDGTVTGLRNVLKNMIRH